MPRIISENRPCIPMDVGEGNRAVNMGTFSTTFTTGFVTRIPTCAGERERSPSRSESPSSLHLVFPPNPVAVTRHAPQAAHRPRDASPPPQKPMSRRTSSAPPSTSMGTPPSRGGPRVRQVSSPVDSSGGDCAGGGGGGGLDDGDVKASALPTHKNADEVEDAVTKGRNRSSAKRSQPSQQMQQQQQLAQAHQQLQMQQQHQLQQQVEQHHQQQMQQQMQKVQQQQQMHPQRSYSPTRSHAVGGMSAFPGSHTQPQPTGRSEQPSMQRTQPQTPPQQQQQPQPQTQSPPPSQQQQQQQQQSALQEEYLQALASQQMQALRNGGGGSGTWMQTQGQQMKQELQQQQLQQQQQQQQQANAGSGAVEDLGEWVTSALMRHNVAQAQQQGQVPLLSNVVLSSACDGAWYAEQCRLLREYYARNEAAQSQKPSPMPPPLPSAPSQAFATRSPPSSTQPPPPQPPPQQQQPLPPLQSQRSQQLSQLQQQLQSEIEAYFLQAQRSDSFTLEQTQQRNYAAQTQQQYAQQQQPQQQGASATARAQYQSPPPGQFQSLSQPHSLSQAQTALRGAQPAMQSVPSGGSAQQMHVSLEQFLQQQQQQRESPQQTLSLPEAKTDTCPTALSAMWTCGAAQTTQSAQNQSSRPPLQQQQFPYGLQSPSTTASEGVSIKERFMHSTTPSNGMGPSDASIAWGGSQISTQTQLQGLMQQNTWPYTNDSQWNRTPGSQSLQMPQTLLHQQQQQQQLFNPLHLQMSDGVGSDCNGAWDPTSSIPSLQYSQQLASSPSQRSQQPPASQQQQQQQQQGQQPHLQPQSTPQLLERQSPSRVDDDLFNRFAAASSLMWGEASFGALPPAQGGSSDGGGGRFKGPVTPIRTQSNSRKTLHARRSSSHAGSDKPPLISWTDPTYAELVRQELERLMGPEEVPSGVPAPRAPPFATRSGDGGGSAGGSGSALPQMDGAATNADAKDETQLPKMPSWAMAGDAVPKVEATVATASSIGSWPRAAFSTRWLSERIAADEKTPNAAAEHKRKIEGLSAADQRRARAEAASRLHAAVFAAERAARHQAAAGADPQLAEAAAAAAARDYRTFVVGQVKGDLPAPQQPHVEGEKKDGNGEGEKLQPSICILGYIGITRPVDTWREPVSIVTHTT